MTTAHEGESLDDVAFFFVVAASPEGFERHLVIHVGTGTTKDQVDAAVRKYALSPDACPP